MTLAPQVLLEKRRAAEAHCSRCWPRRCCFEKHRAAHAHHAMLAPQVLLWKRMGADADDAGSAGVASRNAGPLMLMMLAPQVLR